MARIFCHIAHTQERVTVVWSEGAASFEPYHLADMVKWMRQYSRKTRGEMDLADASLYWLANETGITNIMTTDVAGFSRYRLPDGQAFNLLE